MKKWYILFTNYENTLPVMERLVKTNLPKGCGAYIPTTVQGNEYFKTKLYTKPVYPFYLFICCKEEKHIDILLKKMSQVNVSGYFLRKSNGELATLTSDEIREMETFTGDDEILDEENYYPGEFITVVSGPMKGVSGQIVSISDYYVYISYTTDKNKTIDLPVLFSDIKKEEI